MLVVPKRVIDKIRCYLICHIQFYNDFIWLSLTFPVKISENVIENSHFTFQF
jgi:hypothetical protein